MESSDRKRLLGVPAFLIFIVFALSGISVGLFSFVLDFVILELMDRQSVPAVTAGLLQVPGLAWIALFVVVGSVTAWSFEKSERQTGEVSQRTAGLVAISALILVLLILSGLSLPLMQGMGAASGGA